VFDCGPETPPVCHDGNDVRIATCPKSQGFYSCLLTVPLKPGQIIYDTDGCFDPSLVSPDAIVRQLPAVPLLSQRMMVVLGVALGVVGLLGLRRMRVIRKNG
jgi:hypothetical protein